VRHLDEDARAIARVHLTPAGAPVIEIAEDLQSLLDESMGFPPLDVGYKPDSARIMFVARIVHSLFLRWSQFFHFVVHFAMQVPRHFQEGILSDQRQKGSAGFLHMDADGSFNVQIGARINSVSRPMTGFLQSRPNFFAGRIPIASHGAPANRRCTGGMDPIGFPAVFAHFPIQECPGDATASPSP
jgi:hypothetical protein